MNEIIAKQQASSQNITVFNHKLVHIAVAAQRFRMTIFT